LEELREELHRAQTTAANCKSMEVQLEQCNDAWKEKFLALEARFKAEQLDATLRIEEAARKAELKSQEEIRRLQVELEAVEYKSARSSEDLNSQRRADMERLQREVHFAKESESSTCEEERKRAVEVSRLQSELDLQQEETLRFTEQLQKFKQRASDLEEELAREKAEARRYQLEQANARTREAETEDLNVRLKQVTEERDQLESDFAHLKNANNQRQEECKQLKASVLEEREHIKLLEAAKQKWIAEANLVVTPAQLDSDTILLSQSASSVVSTERASFRQTRLSSKDAASEILFNVDLTEDESPVNKTGAQVDAIVMKEVIHRVEADIEEESTSSEEDTSIDLRGT
jgi:hypothetical protein